MSTLITSTVLKYLSNVVSSSSSDFRKDVPLHHFACVQGFISCMHGIWDNSQNFPRYMDSEDNGLEYSG